MAQEAAINPNTMQKALAKLEEDGLIITHRTSGRSITEDADMVKRMKAANAFRNANENGAVSKQQFVWTQPR
jgi:GntR family transcriptional regulator